jgi:haloalkane dehalogenase
MRKTISLFTLIIVLSLALGTASAQEDDPCHAELEVMTTDDGVEFVRTPDACFENLPDWDYEPQYIEINGLRQAYVDVGSGESGETILLLHGQPSWSYLYRKMIPVLADAGHRVIAMDHLGFGRSDKPIDPDYYTYVGHVERLETFIQELELEGITPFVQDWGSLIGLQVVGTNPDWFDRLVVGNGFLPTYPEGETFFELPENPLLTRTLFHQVLINMPAQQEPLVREPLNIESMAEFETEDNYFGLWIDYSRNDERFRPEVLVEAMTYFDLSPEEEAAYAAPFPSRITMGGARAFPGLANELGGVTDSGWAGLGEFDKPFLTIWGDNDGGNLGDPAVQQILIDHIPGSEGWDHVRLPEASHFLQDDQGEEIARRMNAFIAQSREQVVDPQQASDDSDEAHVGYEILQMISPNEIVVWVNSTMTQEEFDAIDLPLGWFKNQPREGTPDMASFDMSPNADTDGDITYEEHFGHLWMQNAIVVETNIPLDEEGLLTANYVAKFHNVTFNAGRTVPVLTSPEGDAYILISRDSGRTTDESPIPDGWQVVDHTFTEETTFQLPNPTLNIRVGNEDSFQGPVAELSAIGGSAAPAQETLLVGPIPAVTQSQFMPLPEDLRDFRYCEVLAVSLDGMTATVDVYNTMGHNDCPADQWVALDAAAIAERYELAMAKLNGPRYWVIDGIQGRGDSLTGDVVEFDGMEMHWVARIEMMVTAAATQSPYTSSEVQRDTTYVYNAGSTVYELISPEGDVYRMQSYSQIVDPTLTIADLDILEERLVLPEGWRYEARVLPEASELIANGLAVVIQDELQNSYQKVTGDDVTTTAPAFTDDLLRYHDGYWVAVVESENIPFPLEMINDMRIDYETGLVTVYAQSRIGGNVIAPPQVGPGEFTENMNGEMIGFHPNAVYLNGSGQELDEADGTGAWWVKHAWVLNGEGYNNWELMATDYSLGGYYVEGTLMEDGLTMQMRMFVTEDSFQDISVDTAVIADEFYGNMRGPNLDTDPITYEVVRYEPANLDPDAGPIDFTSTPTFTMTLECREEINAFDGLARACPTLD